MAFCMSAAQRLQARGRRRNHSSHVHMADPELLQTCGCRAPGPPSPEDRLWTPLRPKPSSKPQFAALNRSQQRSSPENTPRGVLPLPYAMAHLPGTFYGTEGAHGGTATPEQVWEGQVRRCVLTWLMLQRQHFAKHLQLGMFRTFVFP